MGSRLATRAPRHPSGTADRPVRRLPVVIGAGRSRPTAVTAMASAVIGDGSTLLPAGSAAARRGEPGGPHRDERRGAD